MIFGAERSEWDSLTLLEQRSDGERTRRVFGRARVYVLEGSISRCGDRVGITAGIVDATTGAHPWAERYERELHDVSAVPDEAVRAIGAILAAHMNQAEVERALLKPPSIWQAFARKGLRFVGTVRDEAEAGLGTWAPTKR